MNKWKKIAYWFFTLWLSLGLVSTGGVQLFHMQSEVENFTKLGYPIYLLTLLGIWKGLATLAILVPRMPLLKEWAYAGIFFCMTGATFSRISAGHSIGETFPSVLLLAIGAVSYFLRPADRKIARA